MRRDAVRSPRCALGLALRAGDASRRIGSTFVEARGAISAHIGRAARRTAHGLSHAASFSSSAVDAVTLDRRAGAVVLSCSAFGAGRCASSAVLTDGTTGSGVICRPICCSDPTVSCTGMLAESGDFVVGEAEIVGVEIPAMSRVHIPGKEERATIR